jgi:hypothetical protein
MNRKPPLRAVLGFGDVVLCAACASGRVGVSRSAHGQARRAHRVEFVVTGKAPNGVEIVYGSDKLSAQLAA